MNNSKEPVNPSFIRFTEEGKPFLGTQEQHSITSLGITKREYFAGLAMHGILASDNSSEWIKPEELAKKSIQYADELLKQLENKK